jgi:hypothetical protein
MKIETRKEIQVKLNASSEPLPGEPLKIGGYAAKFNNPYDMGDCWETLAADCFDASKDNPSIVLLWNHDTSKPLGRVSAGNLRVFTDAVGLGFECELLDTPSAREVHALVAAGVYNQCSFGFICEQEVMIREKGAMKPTRKIQRAKLMELSLVCFPANPNTEVSVRELPKQKRRVYLPPEF